MNKIDWIKLGLEKNPFSLIPNKDINHLVWAGLKHTKKKLDTAIKNCLTSSGTSVILNISRWGGGKTHASYFYSNRENLHVRKSFTPPLNVLIITPKEGANAAYEFYKKTVESLSVDYISKSIKQLRSDLPEKESLDQLSKWCNSEELGKILWLMGDQDDDISFEASELLFNKITASTRKKLKLRRGIEDTTDRFKVLSTLFKILSSYDEKSKIHPKRKIFLWLDEIESLILYTTRQYIPFSQALRELVDMTPSYLNFFMNFSLSDYDDLRTLEFIIGKALSDRISEKIIFEELSTKDAMDYVTDLLKCFRIPNFNLSKQYLPFTEDALKSMFEIAPQKTHYPITPRTINKWCLLVLNEANDKGYFDQKKIKEIDVELIQSISFFDQNTDDERQLDFRFNDN